MKYYVPSLMKIEDAYNFENVNVDCQLICAAAEDVAADFYYNRGGCGKINLWPLIFVLLDDEGLELGRFSVARTIAVQFSAAKLLTPEGVIKSVERKI